MEFSIFFLLLIYLFFLLLFFLGGGGVAGGCQSSSKDIKIDKKCWGQLTMTNIIKYQLRNKLQDSHIFPKVTGTQEELSNLMWPFIMLNLHQLTDYKLQLNKNNVNNHKSKYTARSYQRRDRADREAMVDRLLQTG